MAKLSIGTAGFSYNDWIGPFYPKKLEKAKNLEYFSKIFNLVEINSTFYSLPSEEIVDNWYNRVPENFRFIIKVWQEISHKLDDNELNSIVNEFFSRLSRLGPKIVSFLIQFPPWFKYSENHLLKLELLLKKLPLKYNYIIELRDNSWYDFEILSKFIDGENIVLGTTYMPGIIPYYMLNQKNYYIRLIGDRELNVFNRIQREQNEAITDLYDNVQKLMKNSKIYEIFIIVNNHFQGFAPESVNMLKKKFGLPYHSFSNQTHLTDFFS
ncbi:MAG: DUF72 domain-containing protein [Candidatus Thorarchaeota archaeon]